MGDGKAPGPDPVRGRSLHLRRALDAGGRSPNRYFAALYEAGAQHLAGVVGREHTGQVALADRIERETAFREGRLKALFCSPTMELGVDIAHLFVAHMRNVPPTPANYAQRGGRAGRNGRPALVLAFCSQGNAHDEYFFRRKEQMIAGAVKPARLDLANRELVEAHLHAVWLSFTGLGLGSSMADLLDLQDAPKYPLLADKAAQLQLSAGRRHEVVQAFRVGAGDDEITRAPWFTPEWLEQTVQEAPVAFGRALDRWRDLYRAAIRRRDEARQKIDLPRLSKQEKQAAEQQEQEAKHERDMLLNQGGVTEADFYPYRYFANEGLLPGYNFPRLPLRVVVSTHDQAQSIDRPRFLGLTEFGPQNVIYHEGRKHRISSYVIPVGGIEERLTRAKLCKRCGCIYPDEAALVDVCHNCGAVLYGATSDFPQLLFDQSVVRATRSARISSDEEERSREGYEVTTHVRLPQPRELFRAEALAGGRTLLTLTYAPQTELWRINHGWRRAHKRNGFTIDRETGRWRKPEDDQDPDDGADPALLKPLSGVKPYVTDHRNVLLLRPATVPKEREAFMRSLAYALQRAIQFVYEVEEQEVAVELIGQGEQQQLLLWEAAEGGTGVWERLRGSVDDLAKVAKEALRVCHVDPDTGEDAGDWATRCSAACYDCLLSYTNQREHRHLDRHLTRQFLLDLSRSKLMAMTGNRGYEEHYAWLRERLDSASTFERDFLDFLHGRFLRLPDKEQHQPAADLPVQSDFFYDADGGPGICVFVDGPHHDAPQQAAQDHAVRSAAQERGFTVIAVRHDRPLAQAVQDHPEVFGHAAEELP